MRKYYNCTIFSLILILGISQLQAQKLYNPQADARGDIDKAVKEARMANKHVLLQIGGNWCSWCIRFHDYIELDTELDSILKINYIQVYVNYSRENENLPLMKELGYPQRFGFPVFIVLDANGNRIHTQNSAYLEEDKSYDKRKVKEFFTHWTYQAVNQDQ